jgi:hypothetical protein
MVQYSRARLDASFAALAEDWRANAQWPRSSDRFDMNASLKTLASEYGDRMKYVWGLAKEQLGLSALLIRPDGVIAWASDSEPNEQSIGQAVARWFAR